MRASVKSVAMPESALYISNLLGLATLATHVILAFFLFGFLLFRHAGAMRKLISFIRARALVLGLLVSGTGVALSLMYSNVFGLPPCELCWFQRIFLYSSFFLFAQAFLRRDRSVIPYVCMLSGLGLAVALYQVYLQFSPHTGVVCTTSVLDCSVIYIQFAGYITIPVMAVTAFVLLVVVTGFALTPRRAWYSRVVGFFRKGR